MQPGVSLSRQHLSQHLSPTRCALSLILITSRFFLSPHIVTHLLSGRRATKSSLQAYRRLSWTCPVLDFLPCITQTPATSPSSTLADDDTFLAYKPSGSPSPPTKKTKTASKAAGSKCDTHVHRLPRDVLDEIVSCLSHEDLTSLASTSKKVRQLVLHRLFRSVTNDRGLLPVFNDTCLATDGAALLPASTIANSRFLLNFLQKQRIEPAHVSLLLTKDGVSATTALARQMWETITALTIKLPSSYRLSGLLPSGKTLWSIYFDRLTALNVIFGDDEAVESVFNWLHGFDAVNRLLSLELRTVRSQFARSPPRKTSRKSAKKCPDMPELRLLKISGWIANENLADVLSKCPRLESLDISGVQTEEFERYQASIAIANALRKLVISGQLRSVKTRCDYWRDLCQSDVLSTVGRITTVGYTDVLPDDALSFAARCPVLKISLQRFHTSYSHPREIINFGHRYLKDGSHRASDLLADVKSLMESRPRIVQVAFISTFARIDELETKLDPANEDYMGYLFRTYADHSGEHLLSHVRYSVNAISSVSADLERLPSPPVGRWHEAVQYDGVQVPSSTVSEIMEAAGVDWRVPEGGRGMNLPDEVWAKLKAWSDEKDMSERDA